MPCPDWIARLRETHRYPHPVAAVTLVETHISWVLLTGERALPGGRGAVNGAGRGVSSKAWEWRDQPLISRIARRI